MRALVTGASGFLGANVVKALLADGAQVRALVLPNDPAPILAGLDGVERVTGDVTDAASVRKALDGCDTLFHLAAIFKLWLRDPSLIFRVNVDGTRTVLEEAGRAKVARIVYTSSAITCGFPRPGELSDETAPYDTSLVVGNYRTTKYLSENVALEFVRRGLPVVIVNPTVPLGWGDTVPTPTGTLIVNYLNGVLQLAPAWYLNVVSVRDVARGHVMAATRGRIGEKYVLGGENLRVAEILAILDELTGFGLPWATLPPRALLPVGYVAELISRWVTGRDPMVSRESVRVMSASYVFDVSKSQRELGIDPIPARVALQEGVEWFMSTPLVKASRKKRYRTNRPAAAEP
jgi:dihydroflavonol-4-reductase